MADTLCVEFNEWFVHEYPDTEDRQHKFRMSSARELMEAAYQAGRAAAEADRKNAERYRKVKARSFFGGGNQFYFKPVPHRWHIRAHLELDDAVDAIDAVAEAISQKENGR